MEQSSAVKTSQTWSCRRNAADCHSNWQWMLAHFVASWLSKQVVKTKLIYICIQYSTTVPNMVQQLYIASVRITSPRGRSVQLYWKTIFTSMYDSLERFLNTSNTRKLAKSENHPEIWPLVSTRILTQFCVSPVHMPIPTVAVLHRSMLWDHHTQFSISTSYSPPKWSQGLNRTRLFLLSSYGVDLWQSAGAQ